VGAFALTAGINVPMNEALALVAIPEDTAQAQAIWGAYSPRWQLFNTIRTVVSGVVLLMTGLGLLALRR
jgi:uncharacterized membrane protein